MWLKSLAGSSLAAFFTTLLVIITAAPIARRNGLTDAPSIRKRHNGDVPLLGGIAIFIALSLVGAFWGESNQPLITVNGNEALWVFMASGAFLVVTGSAPICGRHAPRL